jgi:hypothetical protein
MVNEAFTFVNSCRSRSRMKRDIRSGTRKTQKTPQRQALRGPRQMRSKKFKLRSSTAFQTRPPSAPPTSGASQNSHSCCSAQPPTKQRLPRRSGRIDGGVGNGNRDQMDQRQRQADGDRREPAGTRLLVEPIMMKMKKASAPSRSPAPKAAKPPWRMLAITVGGKAAELEPALPLATT